MIYKLALCVTFATLAVIAIWLDDSFILFGILIATALFVYFLYLQGKVSFPKKEVPLPENSDTPEDRPSS